MRKNQAIIEKVTIWFLLLTSLAACRTEAPLVTSQPDLSGLNLGFEDTTAAGRPAEWFLVEQSGTVDLTTDATLIHSGSQALLFVSDSSTDARLNLCFNSVLTDVVTESLTLSVMTRVVGNQAPEYGFYSRMIAKDDQGVPVFDTLSNGELSSGWQQHRVSFKKDQLTDYILEFGFWVRGAGTLAADDFAIQIDGTNYPAAIAQSILPIPSAVTTQLENLLISLPENYSGSQPGNYAWLRSTVGDANIVLLGGGTHGTREFTEQRLAITRYLVEEMGFRTVALEANLPEADLVNQQLASSTDQDSLESLIEGLHFWMYRTEEFVSFFRWAQAYNQAHEHPLSIRCIDMQYSQVALEEITSYAAGTKDRMLQLALDSLETNKNAPIRSVQWAQRLTDHLDKVDSSVTIDRMRRSARVALQALTLKDSAPKQSYRDEKMAENAVWLTERAENERVVIWAHNGHIQRTDDAMGNWLSNGPYGDRLVSIGMTTGRGTYLAMDPWSWTLITDKLKPLPPESWEYYLQHAGAATFYLDLRSFRRELTSQSHRRMRTLGGIATPKQFFPAEVGSSPAELFFEVQGLR